MSTIDRESWLIPGRTCGTCNVCCIIPAIDEPELQKQSSVPCVNCGEHGSCKIYQSRPDVCREYYCYWRYKTNLDEAWRPDRSGVFINALEEPAPDDLLGPPIELRILWPQALTWPPFAQLVAQFVRMKIAVYLSIPGPEGHYPVKTLLNPMVAGPVERNDVAAMLYGFQDALQHLMKHPFQPIALKHVPVR
jgi:hypothetical protein